MIFKRLLSWLDTFSFFLFGKAIYIKQPTIIKLHAHLPNCLYNIVYIQYYLYLIRVEFVL